MSLYYEAARFLDTIQDHGGSVKSRIYGAKDLKSKPAHIYALVAETIKWSPVLKEVIEKAGLLDHERKLTPVLSLLLVHDQLLSKGGIAAPASHSLKESVLRHKARLQAELTKARLRRGFSSIETLKSSLSAPGDGVPPGGPAEQHPRWARVNSLKTTLEEQLVSAFRDYKRADALTEVQGTGSGDKILHVDPNIPDLLAFPPGTDLTRMESYRRGQLILQDKASCFPAYLLDPGSFLGDVVDACSAPGNKTTHLAAILYSVSQDKNANGERRRIYACERDKIRSETLAKMVEWAGAGNSVVVNKNQDFLRVDPKAIPYRHVSGILLDPSCSGSGIVGRDDEISHLELPTRPGASVTTINGKKGKSKKRKREPEKQEIPVSADDEVDIATPATESEDKLKERLTNLSSFQLKLLLHAFKFPTATRVVYSTCSVHVEENEQVVCNALASSVALLGGWRILRQEEQVDGLRKWRHRGVDAEGLNTADNAEVSRREIVKACIRCNKGGDGEGTMGFFVAGFVRDLSDANGNSSQVNDDQDGSDARHEDGNNDGGDDEWNGFED